MSLCRGIMLKLLCVCALLLAACANAGSVYARSLADKEKAELTAAIDEFNVAMRDKVYDRIAATVPPKILSAIAKKSGLDADPEKVREMIAGVMKEMFSHVTLESFSMDKEAIDVKELPDGSPYALIPTKTVVAMAEKGRFVEKTFTLGLLDSGKWYLVRVGDVGQLTILREVYPEFTSVELPQGSMEVLKK